MENRITKEEYLLTKLLGLTGRMRKHQKAYFNNGKMPADKALSIKYERLVDEHIKIILRQGYMPIFEDDKQSKLF